VKFHHPDYGIDIDTHSLQSIKLLGQLKKIYEKIPQTKCLKCPDKSGVEADCCKMFSPPMLLIEFINMLNILEIKSRKELNELLYYCYESFINPNYTKPCILLEETICKVYNARPFSCRMFAQYDDKEWEDRLKAISKELNLDTKDVPFCKQCNGIKIKQKSKIKSISKEKSDNIFRSIHALDIELFDDKNKGYETVMKSMTYLPFDAHFLCFSVGPDLLDQLALIKIQMRNLKNQGKEEELVSLKKNVNRLLSNVKDSIFMGSIGDYSN
jgi:Fe-S-cluster containining protein